MFCNKRSLKSRRVLILCMTVSNSVQMLQFNTNPFYVRSLGVVGAEPNGDLYFCKYIYFLQKFWQ